MALASVAGALCLLHAAAAEARGRERSAARTPEPRTREELDISTAADSEQLPNGGMLWGMERPGTEATVALVVRAGARQEDVGKSGAALSTAHWVLDAFNPQEALRLGVTTELEMLAGGPMFVLRGPATVLPAMLGRLLKAALKPNPRAVVLARDHALFDTRRLDFVRGLQDLVSAACWTGTSFELPAWGQVDTIQLLDDGYERLFQATWYLVRNMTVIALGPRGKAPYRALLAGASKARMSRETVAPGEPALPVHQVQRRPVPFSLAGVSMPGPQTAGPALLMRGRAEELLEAAQADGRLQGPVLADVVWTRKSAIVFVAIHHPDATALDERAQGQALTTLQGVLRDAAEMSDDDLNAVRKREGARLSRAFSTPEGALRHLGPMATVSDAPVDLRHAAMATPPDVVRKALVQSRVENYHLSIRHLPKEAH